MKGFKGAVLRRGVRVFALLGAITLSSATAALGQTNSTDSEYLSGLYGFLRSQDAITYTLATREMTDEQNIWAAQSFCQAFASGVSPADVYSVFTSAAFSEASNQGTAITEEIAYAIGLYGGSVMTLGATHYCPQYQPQVQQALRSR
ncbi:MAG: DUF732 domain-containing protein [Phormidesmis sp. RL_2_1]|nr:DUF732 domain-containing protein [Phormidesmis sp. RL_2_1]